VIRTDTLSHQQRTASAGSFTSEYALLYWEVEAHQQKRPARITMVDLVPAEEGDGEILIVIEDLTQNEQLRLAAEGSERHLRELAQSLDAIIWEMDARTLQFTFVDQQAEQILGYPVEQWLKEPDFYVQHIHPEDRNRILASFRATIADGEDHTAEYRFTAADDRLVWLRARMGVVKGGSRPKRQLCGVMVDITVSKRAEERVREVDAKYRTFLERVPAVIYLAAADESNTTLYISPQIKSLLRISPEEWLADADMFFRQVHPDDRRRVRDELARSYGAGDRFRCEYRLRARDGSVVYVYHDAAIMRDRSGQPLRTLGVLLEIARGERRGCLAETGQFV
jgi:PAS domain S-box-containing protein